MRQLVRGKQYIQSKQILWAKRNGLKLSGSEGEKGLLIYTDKLEDNRFEPLSREHKKQFQKEDGAETNDTLNRVAKMKALHSSSVIGINFFSIG